jgi:hypothetical protein
MLNGASTLETKPKALFVYASAFEILKKLADD